MEEPRTCGGRSMTDDARGRDDGRRKRKLLRTDSIPYSIPIVYCIDRVYRLYGRSSVVVGREYRYYVLPRHHRTIRRNKTYVVVVVAVHTYVVVVRSRSACVVVRSSSSSSSVLKLITIFNRCARDECCVCEAKLKINKLW